MMKKDQKRTALKLFNMVIFSYTVFFIIFIVKSL